MTDAYCAYYVNAQGSGGAEICGDYAVWKYPSSESSWLANGKDGEKRQIVHETRVIAGRPALVTYSPLGQHHYALATIEVRVYDPATQTTYYIYVGDSTMRGADVDATIALAASLFEPPNPP